VVAAADQAERSRVGPGEPARGDGARGTGSELPEASCLDDRDKLAAALVLEQDDGLERPVSSGDVALQAAQAGLEVDGRHHGQGPVLEPEPRTGKDFDHAASEFPLALLDGGVHRLGIEKIVDVVLVQVERHARLIVVAEVNG